MPNPRIEGAFTERSIKVLASGLPRRGKTPFLAAVGRELILVHSKRVLLRQAFKLVGQLLTAKRDLRIEQAEALFTLLAERYERRSWLIGFNIVFSQLAPIFKDPMTTLAAIYRLVHHSIIPEFDWASQRVKKGTGKTAKLDGR